VQSPAGVLALQGNLKVSYDCDIEDMELACHACVAPEVAATH
jgi:hypothetical protein